MHSELLARITGQLPGRKRKRELRELPVLPETDPFCEGLLWVADANVRCLTPADEVALGI